jgi:hypothetical protein
LVYRNGKFGKKEGEGRPNIKKKEKVRHKTGLYVGDE